MWKLIITTDQGRTETRGTIEEARRVMAALPAGFVGAVSLARVK